MLGAGGGEGRGVYSFHAWPWSHGGRGAGLTPVFS